VRTVQRVTRIDIVVEPDIVKPFRYVAGITVLTEMAVVIVVIKVAGDAGRIHAIAERVITVAVATNKRRMLTEQFEGRVTRVVKRCVVPVSRLMAVAALLATAPVMCVVIRMATETRGRRLGKRVLGVAVETACRLVGTDQCKIGD